MRGAPAFPASTVAVAGHSSAYLLTPCAPLLPTPLSGNACVPLSSTAATLSGSQQPRTPAPALQQQVKGSAGLGTMPQSTVQTSLPVQVLYLPASSYNSELRGKSRKPGNALWNQNCSGTLSPLDERLCKSPQAYHSFWSEPEQTHHNMLSEMAENQGSAKQQDITTWLKLLEL